MTENAKNKSQVYVNLKSKDYQFTFFKNPHTDLVKLCLSTRQRALKLINYYLMIKSQRINYRIDKVCKTVKSGLHEKLGI